jgi:hypothetical protein
MYIKALEQEVLRLKEVFRSTARERDAFAEENRRLKELLIANGISFDQLNLGTNRLPHVGGSSYGGSSRGSISAGYGPPSNSTGYTSPPNQRHGSLSGPSGQTIPQQQPQQPNGGMDYDQLGVDFVLTYDRTPYLSPPPQQ